MVDCFAAGLFQQIRAQPQSCPLTAPLEKLEKPENSRTGDRRTLLGQGVTLETGTASKEKYKIRLHSAALQDKYVIKYLAILELVLSYFVNVETTRNWVTAVCHNAVFVLERV